MVCSKCKTDNPTHAKFCSSCGNCLNCPRPSFLSRHKWWFTGSLVFIIFILLPFLAFLTFVGLISEDVSSSDQAKTIIHGSSDNEIALIPINGEIVENNSSSSFPSLSSDTTSVQDIQNNLDKIAKDPHVKGILLEVNSPGGSAAASDEIYHMLVDFKKNHNIKIVAYFSDIAASGGYYVSQSADKIIANPSTITGSIGVIISYLNYGDLAAKYGVQEIVYKSGPHKDLVSNFREPTDEEKAIMQSVVDDAYTNFVQTVSTGRNLSVSQVKDLADGRIFSAKQAKQVNLIDDLGTFQTSVEAAQNLSGVQNASVVEYGQPGFLNSLLGSLAGRFNLNVLSEVSQVFDFSPGIKVMYMYSH